MGLSSFNGFLSGLAWPNCGAGFVSCCRGLGAGAGAGADTFRDG